MKYIIFNKQIPIIFPDEIHHNEVATGFPNLVPSSAGHIEVGGDNGEPVWSWSYGAAETIGMLPVDGDEDIILEMLKEAQ